MGLSHSPSIVTEGLEFYIDPSNTRSYPGFGNTIYNIVNSSMGSTFVNYTVNPIDNAGNRSIYFDGSSNAVFIPSSNLQFGSSDFTIQFWFKIQGMIDGKVLFCDSWGITNGGFLFYTSNFGSERILYYSTSTSGTWDIANEKDLIVSPRYNTWYNVAVTRTGNTFTLYTNGQAVNTFSSSLSLRNTGYPYSLGASPVAGNACKCSIGSVFIYRNKGLSAAEINQNYHATKKKYLVEENIVTNGLVLNYDFNKTNSYPGTGSVVTDLSTTGNNGSLLNSPTFTSLNGGGMVFNGSNQYLNVPSNPSLTNQITVSVWIKPSDTNGNSWIIGREGGYRLFYTSNLIIWDCATVNNSWYTTGTNILSPSLNVLDSWWHIVATYDGSNNRLYINGELKTTGANISGNIANGNNLWIMYVSVAGINYGKGTIGEIKIYNRALSAQEIQQNYNATKGRFLNALPPVRNGLVLELDALSYSGFGNTWYDSSGNGYNTTLSNGPTLSGSGTTLSIAFDGSNDYGISNINKTVLGSSFTISFLFSVASSAYGCIFQFADQLVTGVPWIFLNRESSSLINWYINGEYRLQAGVSTTENAFISITYSNNLWTSYKNGAALGTTSTGIGSFGGNNLIFAYGYFAPTSSKFNLFTIHNRALSAYEIKQNFDYYRTRYGI